MTKRVRTGFTLIELLVVISIIALLIALLLPALGLAKEMGRRAVCGSNVRTLVQAVHLYAQDNGDEIPDRSGYYPITLDYFQPGPGGPTSNGTGDFSGLYPNYVSVPEVHYCPSGPWTADTPAGEGGAYTSFYSYNPWHNFATVPYPWTEMWGRSITYYYFGKQSVDIIGSTPPLDFDGNVVEFPLSVADNSDLVLITDANWYNSDEDGYGRSTHPSNPANASAEADYSLERSGLNVGHLDGSVKWRHESDTHPRLMIRNGWWARH